MKQKQTKLNKQTKKPWYFRLFKKKNSWTISATYKFTKSEKNLRRPTDQSDQSAMIMYGMRSSVLMKHVSN